MTLEVGDFVLCTVDRIAGTVVFVKILTEKGEIEGSIVMSEIAPGRIRNIRDYVVPKKKIVCKVLRISPQGNIDLSLRRVSQKDRKEVIEQEAQQKSYISILKSVLGNKAEEVIKEVSIEEAKSESKKLEKLVGKKDAEKILEIINLQKKKKTIIKKEILLTSTKSDGITLIKKVLDKLKGIDVRYISAGKYSLEIESEDVKTADKKMREMIFEAEKEAKKLSAEFSVR
ncbi:hypothetical protein M0R19_00305 [Candidatus Pacearchaeota archaeon]|nr:hypothetical protein [Candidatus Pacearchaeota archaeon]